MILIISDNNDLSTWQVVDWIKYHYKIPVEVITDKDEITLLSIFEDGDFEFSHNGKIINSKNIESYWYRRGALRSKNKELELKGLDAPYIAIFSDYYERETNRILQYINWKLEQKRSISSAQKSTVNKLIVLDTAKKIGLNTLCSSQIAQPKISRELVKNYLTFKK